MIGTVTMKLSRANIRQAVEDWLEKELSKRPRVISVDQEQYQKDDFTVVFSHDPLVELAPVV